MANTLQLQIVTPEAQTYSDQVEMVTLPGIEGEMGVYPNHVPLMTQLVPAKLSCARTDRISSWPLGMDLWKSQAKGSPF
jgi:F-type H+-transporting ATPase subunit epsilon